MFNWFRRRKRTDQRAGVRRGGGGGPRRSGGHTEALPMPGPAPDDRRGPPPTQMSPMAPPAPPPPVYQPQPAYAPPQQPVHHAPPPRPSGGGDPNATQFSAVARRGRVVGVLVGVDGPVSEQVLKLHDGENVIGRHSLGIDDKTVSREHAVIIHQDGSFGIRALKAENPTFVDGRQVDGEILSDGATIRLGTGSVSLKFRTI